MAEEFGFFDPVEIAPDVWDREYNAEEFTDYFGDLVTTGVMKGKGAELKVSANGSNMITEIDTGVAFVEGKRYANTAKLAHTHDTESLGKNRIDRIVVRMDLNERWVKSFVKKGVASTAPVAPTLTQSDNVYEISLAQVKVIGGQTYISASNVTDERGKDVICPWAGSNILPNFDDAALAELVSDVGVLNNEIDLKANKKQQNFIYGTPQSGWLASSSLRYYKDEFGIVHVTGHLHSGTMTSSTPLFTLPLGYRPDVSINGLFSLMTMTSDSAIPRPTACYFTVDGEFRLLGASLNRILIDISFRVL